VVQPADKSTKIPTAQFIFWIVAHAPQ